MQVTLGVQSPWHPPCLPGVHALVQPPGLMCTFNGIKKSLPEKDELSFQFINNSHLRNLLWSSWNGGNNSKIMGKNNRADAEQLTWSPVPYARVENNALQSQFYQQVRQGAAQRWPQTNFVSQWPTGSFQTHWSWWEYGLLAWLGFSHDHSRKAHCGMLHQTQLSLGLERKHHFLGLWGLGSWRQK